MTLGTLLNCKTLTHLQISHDCCSVSKVQIMSVFNSELFVIDSPYNCYISVENKKLCGNSVSLSLFRKDIFRVYFLFSDELYVLKLPDLTILF